MGPQYSTAPFLKKDFEEILLRWLAGGGARNQDGREENDDARKLVAYKDALLRAYREGSFQQLPDLEG